MMVRNAMVEDMPRIRRFYEKHGFCWDGSEQVSRFDGAVEVRYARGSWEEKR